MTDIHIGTSGFSYKHWKGVFYPEKLPSTQWFEYYMKSFNTVELNTTFYHLPGEKTVRSWNEKSGKDFVFSLKASRYITHVKRMKDPDKPVEKFYSALEPVLAKTGPVLFQMPPSAKKKMDRLKIFLRVLKKFSGKKVLELRHPSWWDREVMDVLAKNRICLCWTSMPGQCPPEVETAEFLYVRMHGADELYRSRYRAQELEKLAKKIYKSKVNEAYIYFNNDFKGYAVENALKLKEVTND